MLRMNLRIMRVTFSHKKIAAYPIVETDVESLQIKHRMF